MSNLGYFQLPTLPGARTLRIREGRSAEVYRFATSGGLLDLDVGADSLVKALLDVDAGVVPPGCTLDWLGSSLMAIGGRLVPLWVLRASRMDAAGNKADIAKPCETIGFECFWRSAGCF